MNAATLRAVTAVAVASSAVLGLAACYSTTDYRGPLPTMAPKTAPIGDYAVGDPLPIAVAERLLADDSTNDRAYVMRSGDYVLTRRNTELPTVVRNDIIGRVHDRFAGVRTARQYREVLADESLIEAEASRSSGRVLRVIDPLCVQPEDGSADDLCAWPVGSPADARAANPQGVATGTDAWIAQQQNSGIFEWILVPPPPPAPPPAPVMGG